jgi:hypothetical protein
MIKLTPCPHCNAPLDLLTQIEQQDIRDTMSALLNHPAAGPIIAYLGMFKPRKQFLRSSRAKALLDDLLPIIDPYPSSIQIAALTRTVESLDAKRQSPTWKPLQNHHYLMRVLEDANHSIQQVHRVESQDRVSGKLSGTMNAIGALINGD